MAIKKHMRRLFISFFVGILSLAPSFSFAQPSPHVAVLADVNLSNASIVSNDGKVLVVGVDIENRSSSTQPDIRYGIQLVRPAEGKREIADSFIAQETVVLSGNQSVHKEFSYSIPPSLSGDFGVWIIARTTGGLMLGLNDAGKVTFSASGDRVTVVPGSCHLVVSGDEKTYTLSQGVDVSTDETLSIVCSVKNESGTALSLIPYFDTFRRNIYGDRVDVNYPVPTGTLLAQGETKELSIDIPKASDPQAYDVSVVLKKASDRTSVAPGIVVHYVLRGESATIQNVSFDKSSYLKGDLVNATVFVTPSADNFPGSRAGRGTDAVLSVKFSVTDRGGNICVEQQMKTLEKGASQLLFSAPAIIGCDSPTAAIVVNGSDGRTLDFRGAGKDESQTPKGVPVPERMGFSSVRTMIVVIVAILFIVSLGLIIWRRFGKKDGISKVFVIAFILSGSMFFSKGVEAKTWAVYAEDIDTGEYFEAADFTVNTNKTTYAPGETIQLYGSAEYLHCSNGYGGYVLWASLIGNSDVGLGENDLGYSGWDDGEHDIYWLSDMVGGTLRAPSVPGEYNIRIHGYFEMDGDTGYDAVTIRITVAAPINASCGTANGVAVSSAPSTNLCSVGTAFPVTGTGPWSWTCTGLNGGTDASCSAPKAPTLRLCQNGIYYARGGETGIPVALNQGDERNLTAIYGPGTDCTTVTGDIDVTSSITDTASDVVTLLGSNPKILHGNNVPNASNPGQQTASENVTATYSGQTVTMPVTVLENCVSGCATEAGSHCKGESFTADDSCGVSETCSNAGTRSCEFNWKEIVPGF